MNPVGAISSRCVCFQRFRNLVAVDPLTGELLWVRHDIPPGSQVFGDDQYIFVLPAPQANPSGPPPSDLRPARGPRSSAPGRRVAGQAQLADGQLSRLGGRATACAAVAFSGNAAGPSATLCLATLGRNILTWHAGSATDSPSGGSSLGKKGPRWNCSIPGNSGPSGRRAASAPVAGGAGGRGGRRRDGARRPLRAPGTPRRPHHRRPQARRRRPLGNLPRPQRRSILAVDARPTCRSPVSTNSVARPGHRQHGQPFHSQGPALRLRSAGEVAVAGPAEDPQPLVPAQAAGGGAGDHLRPAAVRAVPTGQWSAKTHVLCIEKRSGRILYRNDDAAVRPTPWTSSATRRKKPWNCGCRTRP